MKSTGPKYKFEGWKKFNGHTLHRIVRISDGKYGGLIEKEENLSQEGNCWVEPGSYVYGDAKVSGNANVGTNSIVCGAAEVSGNAKLWAAEVSGNAKISGNADVSQCSIVGNAKISDNAKVAGGVTHACKIGGNVEIYGDATVYTVYASDNVKIYGNAKVDQSTLNEDVQVYGQAKVTNVELGGKTQICGNAEINENTILLHGEVVYANIVISDNNIYDTTNKVMNNTLIDCITKIDESSTFKAISEYTSIEEYFNAEFQNNIDLDTISIYTSDTKIPFFKLEKTEKDNQIVYKYIISLTASNGESFSTSFIIEKPEQLKQSISRTIDMLSAYDEFKSYRRALYDLEL